MLQRLVKLPKNQSFFLFGARGTGKSTLIKQQFDHENAIYIDLLDPSVEDRLSRNPNELIAHVKTLNQTKTHIIIDEVQKIPKLLDVVHHLIETSDKKFILTGSSARKLKRGGANLLAGRAFVYHLYPFSYLELGNLFHLDDCLRWGSLPRLLDCPTAQDKMKFLQAYSYTYLKEEIWSEHFIKKLDPFRKFLEVSGQCNGKIINYANIARDVGVDDKTIAEYFLLLEDTLLGFFLEPFHHSFRRRLSAKPKFYYIDPGITRSLAGLLSLPLKESTSAYGEVFEHFIISEIIKLTSYYNLEYRFSYLKTKDDAEVDLVVERPGKKPLFIEIKSGTEISMQSIANFSKLCRDFGECEAICLSRDPIRKKFENVIVYYWMEGLKEYFIS